MATPSSSSTSSSEPAPPGARPGGRPLAALAWALPFVLGMNALVGYRLPDLVGHSLAVQVLELDHQVARLREPGRVEVLVLGNSHAQHMLRPPSLGPALGLRAEAVFSLALPGASALETGLLARRHAGRFPAARLALVGVDEALLAMDPLHYDQRVRLLTRFDPAARWRYAGALPHLEHRVSALGWLPFPVGDFAPALLAGLTAEPALMARRLAGGEKAAGPGGASRQADLRKYPWGSPPQYDRDWTTPRGRALARRLRTPAALERRAGVLFAALHGLEPALADLEATCRALEARGLAVQLVAPVYTPAMHAYLAQARAADVRRYEAALHAHLAAHGRTLVAPPIAATQAAFNDIDHLSSEGARRYAAALAPRLRAKGLLPPGGG